MKRFVLTLVAFVVLCVPQHVNAQTKQEKTASLQSYNYQKYYIWNRDNLGEMSDISSDLYRQEATWYLVPGLADSAGVSFRSLSAPNFYLRHQDGRVKLHPLEDADLFRQDATFKVVKGLADETWASLESVNYPGSFMRHKDGALWVERDDGTSLFHADATFRIVAPLGQPALPAPVQTPASLAKKGFSLSGAAYRDIVQGGADTCWILASIAELQSKGYDLTKRIRYEGNNQYQVKLYNWNKPASRPAGGMHVRTVRVYFDGKRSGADPAFDPRNPRSAWAVIMQRAVVQAVHDWDPGQVIESPHSGNAGDALAILTGQWNQQCIVVGDANAQQIVRDAVAARKIVVFGTKEARTLVGNHNYAVLGTSNQGLTLYNPHGSQLTVSWNLINAEGACFFILR